MGIAMDQSKTDGNQTCIFLWTYPRCSSTVIAKCLSFVEGVQMWNEPYTAAFLCHIAQIEEAPISKVWAKMVEMSAELSKETHEFSNSKLLDLSLLTYPFVQSKLEEEEPGAKYVFVKEIAISIVGHYELLPKVPTRHTFLIRHPYRWLSSRRKLYVRLTKSEDNPDDFDMYKAAPKFSSRFPPCRVLLCFFHSLILYC